MRRLVQNMRGKKQKLCLLGREKKNLAVAMATHSTPEWEGRSSHYLPPLSPFFLIKDREGV